MKSVGRRFGLWGAIFALVASFGANIFYAAQSTAASISLPNVYNFRDMSETGIIKPGVLYRSARLCERNNNKKTIPASKALADALDKGVIIDLRQSDDIAKDCKDPVFSGNNPSNKSLPIKGRSSDDGYRRTFVGNGESQSENKTARTNFGEALKQIVSHDTALFHCTAGKDRTGWLATMVTYIVADDLPIKTLNEKVKTAYEKSNNDLPDGVNPVKYSFLKGGLNQIDKNFGGSKSDTSLPSRDTVMKYITNGIADGGLGVDQSTVDTLIKKLKKTKDDSAQTIDLTIGSYNMTGPIHVKGEGRTSPVIDSRAKQIADNIAKMDMDAVGMQERHLYGKTDTILKALNDHHGNHWASSSTVDGEDDQLQYIWNTNVVELKDKKSKEREYSGKKCATGGSYFVNIGYFEVKATGEKFVMLNFHPPNQGKSFSGECQKDVTKFGIDYFNNNIKSEYSNTPIFAVGDYNSKIKGPVYNYMTKEAGFKDAITSAGSKDMKTNTIGDGSYSESGSNIDHIYYKNIDDPSLYKTLNCKAAPAAGGTITWNTSDTCGSDHHPISATFGVGGDARSSNDDSCENNLDKQKEIFSLGIPYYNVASCTCELDSSASISGDNVDYAGNTVLDKSTMAKIAENQPFYEKSATAAGIPWQLIAVIHLRENSLKRDGGGNGQGPYQDYGRKNIPASLKDGKNWKGGNYTDKEFQVATDWIAEHLKTDYSLHPDKLNSDEAEIKNLFFRYNGQAGVYKDQAADLGYDRDTQGYEGSPYVMNRADLKRDPTVEPTKSNNTWGQIKTDGGSISYPANSDYGAFVVFYAGLGGIAKNDPTTSPGVGGCPDVVTDGYDGIASTAIMLSTDNDIVCSPQTAAGCKSARDNNISSLTQLKAYVDAREKYKTNTNDAALNYGADCGNFVATVMRASGADPNYPASSSSGQLAYLKKHTELYKEIPISEKTSEDVKSLQPGDILVKSGHTFIYIGDGNIAEAAQGHRFPYRLKFYYYGSGYSAFRYVGSNGNSSNVGEDSKNVAVPN